MKFEWVPWYEESLKIVLFPVQQVAEIMASCAPPKCFFFVFGKKNL